MEKIDVQQQMKSSRNEKECTFRPRTCNKSVDLSFDEFLKSEQAFSSHRDQTLADGRKAREMCEASAMRDKPVINQPQPSVLLVSARSVAPAMADDIYSRLASGKSVVQQSMSAKKSGNKTEVKKPVCAPAARKM